MLLFAATALEKLQNVPKAFWVNALMAVGGFIVAVVLIRNAARMNKFVLGMIVFLFFSVVCFQWIFERNEPKVLTPYVEKIAPFFPSKIDYYGKQQNLPKDAPR
jgi:hypothetical protein